MLIQVRILTIIYHVTIITNNTNSFTLSTKNIFIHKLKKKYKILFC